MSSMINNVKLGLLRGYLHQGNASDKAIYDNAISNLVIGNKIDATQADYLQKQVDELMK